MKRIAKSTILLLAMFISAPAYAAPAEQADCAYGRLNDADRDSVGIALFAAMDKNSPYKSDEKQARAKIVAAIKSCADANGWSENEALSAFTYTSKRLLAGMVEKYLIELGGDAAVADLFYAQNKYIILEESAAGNSSREWANTRLVEMGFAKSGARAFEVVWLYLDLLFQIDATRDTFISGVKPE